MHRVPSRMRQILVVIRIYLEVHCNCSLISVCITTPYYYYNTLQSRVLHCILQTFFNSGAMASVRETFCVYHITAPGQEKGAEDLPEGYTYPTMDELSEQVIACLQHISSLYCFCISSNGVLLGFVTAAKYNTSFVFYSPCMKFFPFSLLLECR